MHATSANPTPPPDFPPPTSQSMLNRFLSGKTEAIKGPRKKRPYLATECRDLNEADKWRQEILREIGKKVMEVQNAALGVFLRCGSTLAPSSQSFPPHRVGNTDCV